MMVLLGGRVSELPIERLADVADLQATEAFSVLADETRLNIVLTLWEAENPQDAESVNPSERTALSFSRLRERVPTDTSSNFYYHLDQLTGSFVTKSEHGYELLPAGEVLVQTIIASAGFTNQTLEQVSTDYPCPKCGETTAITYQRQRLYHICFECDGYFDLGDQHPSGILGAWISNPSVMRRESGDAVIEAVKTELFHMFAMRAAGVCPRCSGRIDWTLHVCDNHQIDGDETCQNCQRKKQSVGKFGCRECKNQGIAPPSALGLIHPAVIGYCWDHDIALGYNAEDTVRGVKDTETEVISTDPPKVRVTWFLDDEISLIYDHELNVVKVSEDS